jgi:hypothetical protein
VSNANIQLPERHDAVACTFTPSKFTKLFSKFPKVHQCLQNSLVNI